MEASAIIGDTIMILAIIMAPGLALTAAFIPKLGGIRLAERLGLSLVFGLTPYLILHFLAKNANIPLTTGTTLIVIAIVTVASAAVWRIRLSKSASEGFS